MMTELSSGGHRLDVRVYYEDTDAGGVVYHANYLRFAERARTEALRDAGAPHAELVSGHGLMFMVRRVKVDYLAPARLDDRLVVTTATVKLRGASVELQQRVSRDGVMLAGLELQMVCVRCRSEEHTSELQSHLNLLCPLLL